MQLVCLVLCLSLCAAAASTKSTTTTAPGERVLELLSQVKSNTKDHSELSEAHETIRASICQSKTTNLAEHVNLLTTRLGEAGGNATESTQNSTDTSPLGMQLVAEDAMHDSINAKHRQNDIHIYANQIGQLNEVRGVISDGFKHNLEGFNKALHIRTLSHELFMSHSNQYNSYTTTLDNMLAMMQHHAGIEEAKNAVRESELNEVADDTNALSDEATSRVAQKEQLHERKELYDAQSERLYEVVSAVTKSLREQLALEMALDKEADGAWNDAAMERDELGQETDGMLEKLDAKTSVLKEEIRALGGLSTPNATNLITKVDPDLIEKLSKDLDFARNELNLWDASCHKQSDTFLKAQEQRASVLDRVGKLESWIQDSLMAAKSVLGGPGSSQSGSEQEGSRAAAGSKEKDLAAAPLSEQQQSIARQAYAALAEREDASTLPLDGVMTSVSAGTFKQTDEQDGSIRMSFDVETDKQEIIRMTVVRPSKDAPTIEFANAEIVSSPGASTSTTILPKVLDVKHLEVELEKKDPDNAVNEEEGAATAGTGTGGEDSDGGVTGGATGGEGGVTGVEGSANETEEAFTNEDVAKDAARNFEPVKL